MGLFNQNQLISNLNLRVSSRFSLFGFYSLNFANANTSGASSFPSNSYDVGLDYGRAAFAIRQGASARRGTPVGQLSSALFGKSNSLAGGGFGPPGGGNRNIDFQVAFSF
jgi:hypothetical protein